MINRLYFWKQRTKKGICHLTMANYRKLLMELYARNVTFAVDDNDPSVLDLGFIKVGRIRFTVD